ncbi:MAG: extracellular solute-binding protein [Limnochordia bacterium]|jgi:multiple sugar transport system substrate-binding protein
MYVKKTTHIILGVCMAILLSMPSCIQAAETKLVVATRHAPGDPDLLALAEAFEKEHPDVKIEFVWEASMSDQLTHPHSVKLMTMVAGGIPPDVAYVAGQNVSQYALQGLLLPLDDYIRRSQLQPSDFIPPAWRQTQWDGKTYAMTIQVDPNFALIWNKLIFAEAGLDTERGPTTIAEYEEYFRKLTRADSGGVVTQLGGAPWDCYGNSNTLFTWGWAFGGEFYDAKARQVTAADPRIIESLEWIRGYHQRFSGFAAGGFPNNRLAMRPAVSQNYRSWLTSFPDIPLGIGRMPYKEGVGISNAEWLGGWAIGILPTTRHPDEAWDFVHYFTASIEGTTTYARSSGWIPAYLRSHIFRDFAQDRAMAVYLEIAQTARNIRPPMPAIIDFFEELDIVMKDVLAGRIQPPAALQRAQERAQRALDEMLHSFTP